MTQNLAYFGNKDCERCSLSYHGYKASKYCTPCRKLAKSENEMFRYKNDAEYRQKRKQSRELYESKNKENRSLYFKEYCKKNSKKIVQYQKAYSLRNPEKVALKVRKRNLKKFRLTIEDYENLLQSQNGVCAICKQACATGRRLAVDHCHQTGNVRGLLCGKCNRGLGYFKDDASLIYQAYNYLSQLKTYGLLGA